MRGEHKMRYEYTYRNNGPELWQLSMYYTYGSMVGVCNIIFTVAVMALAVSRWNDAGIMMRCMMVLGCLLFTVISCRRPPRARGIPRVGGR